jgi:hypothetical protein
VIFPPKICPECDEEYIHTTAVCIHCDVPLVLDGEQSEESATQELPPVSELVCVRAAPMSWATALSEKLAEAGISHRIQGASDDADEGSQRRPGYNMPFGIFVLPEDQEAASEIDAEFTGSQIPDIPEDLETDLGEGDHCPACGDSIPESATECPGCGLAMLELG